MKALVWITITLFSFLCCLVMTAGTNSSYHFARAVAGQQLSVVIQTGPFDATMHDVKRTPAGVLIDGTRPMGNDGDSAATTEFKRFEISWNGKDIHLDKASYYSIFNIPLNVIVPGETNSAGFAIIPAQDGRSLLFYFKSEGGPVPEQVWLVVDSAGTWKRFHSWDLFEKGRQQ
jgi:hypothetical protein